jgi:hypothetical protein
VVPSSGMPQPTVFDCAIERLFSQLLLWCHNWTTQCTVALQTQLSLCHCHKWAFRVCGSAIALMKHPTQVWTSQVLTVATDSEENKIEIHYQRHIQTLQAISSNILILLDTLKRMCYSTA